MKFEYILLGSIMTKKLRLNVRDPFNPNKWLLRKEYTLKKPIRGIGGSSRRYIYAKNEMIARREIHETKLNRRYQGFMMLSGKGVKI